MRLKIVRVATSDDGTPGVLLKDNYIPFLLCFEEAWRGNQHNISCIPAGVYKCQRILTQHHGETFVVLGIPGNRVGVLFHSGNTEADTEGCILLGMQYQEMYAVDDQSHKIELQPAVKDSDIAFKKFMKFMTGIDEFDLEIEWCACVE